MTVVLNPALASRTILPPATRAAWYVAEDIAQSDASAVAAWADRSGNGLDLAQSTSGQRPTYRTGILNGKPVVRFDGSDDVLTRATTPSISQPVSIVCVARLTDVTDTDVNRCPCSSNSTTLRFAHVFAGSATGALRMSGGTNITGTFIPTVNTWHLYEGMFNGGTSGAHVDGTQNLTGAGGANAMTGFRIGCNSSNTEFWLGEIAEVIVYARDLNTADHLLLAQYFNFRYGLANARL